LLKQMKTRIQKLMAEANVASRRAAEQLIEQGRVRVNGNVVTLGDKADPETDVIEVDGERLKLGPQQKKVYFALYKPKNVLTTSAPHRGDERQTVLDLIPHRGHLFTIGRLDADSEGLVVLTNDGDLAHRLTHPRYRHTKTYKVTVRGLPSEAVLKRWEEGIWLEEEGKTAPCLVSIVKGSPRETVLRVIMTEGKKRQIRRVALALGHPVERLVRTQIGMLSVEGLRPGEWRELSAHDVHELSTPSPAFKELRAKRQERGAESRSQPRGEMRDAEYRPRRRPLTDETEENVRPRRSGFRGGDDTRSSERPRRTPEASGDRGKPRHSFDNARNEERPRNRSEDSETRMGERPRRSTSEASTYRDKPRRRPLNQESQGEERPYRPHYRTDDNTRAEKRPRRPFVEETKENARPRRQRFQSDDNTRSSERPRRAPEASTHSDKPRRYPSDSEKKDEERPRRPRYRSDNSESRSDEHPRRRAEGESRQGNQSRSPRRSSDPRRNDDSKRPARRSSGTRTQRDDRRPGRRSSDNRPNSQTNRRSRSGRNDE
jgi:pseudouridine synthase